MKTVITLVCLAVAASTAQAFNVLFEEDFESYNSNSEVTDGVNGTWLAIDGAAGQLVDETYTQFLTLDDVDPQDVGARAFPEGGQGYEHLGSGTVQIDLAALNGGQPLVPTSSQAIVVEGDIFDVGVIGNKRMSIGLRSSSAIGGASNANIVELGHWNDPAPVVGFAHRGILFASPPSVTPNPNWQFYDLSLDLDREGDDEIIDDVEQNITTNSDIGEAWSRYRAIITETQITYQIDLFADGKVNDDTENPADGTYDATVTYDLVTDANGYNSLRIGSPSGAFVSSAGNNFYGGVIFDNLKVWTVAPLEGDYNNDGLVNAADYTVYRDTLGDSVATNGAGADGNGNGVIDTGDYTVWADNFGNDVFSAASGLATAVPEPSALLVALAGLGVAVGARRR